MKLVELETAGFAGVRDGVHSFATGGSPSPLVVVRGAPRSGRTSFLRALIATKQAIAAYPASIPASVAIVEGRPARGRLRLQDDAAELAVDRSLEGAVVLPSESPVLDAQDPRLVDHLRRFDSGEPTPKMWFFDETTGLGPAPSRATRRLPSPRELAGCALAEQPTKQSYVRAILEELLRLDAEDLGEELRSHGAVVGERASSRRSRVDAALSAFGMDLRLAGSQRDGSVLLARDGRLAELCELSSSERRAVAVVATAVLVDLSCAVVLADGFAEGGDAGRWVEGLRHLCPRGQLFVTAPLDARWAAGAATVTV